MLFIHICLEGNKHARGHVHSVEALAALSLQDVVKYMNLKTLDTLTPTPDVNPISWRGAMLGFDKKSISFCMKI
jgi:hypothetical protein